MTAQSSEHPTALPGHLGYLRMKAGEMGSPTALSARSAWAARTHSPLPLIVVQWEIFGPPSGRVLAMLTLSSRLDQHVLFLALLCGPYSGQNWKLTLPEASLLDVTSG